MVFGSNPWSGAEYNPVCTKEDAVTKHCNDHYDKLNIELVSLAHNDGVGDLKGECVEGLRDVQWSAYTAYGIGGPVRGIPKSLYTNTGYLKHIKLFILISSADGNMLICRGQCFNPRHEGLGGCRQGECFNYETATGNLLFFQRK